MKTRLEFQCWNCPKTYTLLREIADVETLFVACPYCGAEGTVELEPFKKKTTLIHMGTTTVYRALPDDKSKEEMVLELPDILPTKQIINQGN